MRLAIVSDAHLFQSFVKNYDPLYDFKTVLQKIKEENAPDALLIGGDMFDYKKTAAAYLRHYEGEGLMIRVRDILREAGMPCYAIRGNHEKEEVLRGLNQTVEGFHYVKNDRVNLGDVSIYFMDTHFAGELYEPNVVSQIVQRTASSAVKTTGEKILLCHESFEPFPNCLPKEVIEGAGEVFDWIVNGHMHVWNSSAYGLKNVITLPSLLPSRVILGKYWTERFVWEAPDTKPRSETRGSPFGYATLDTESGATQFCPFAPSRNIVEVSVDATALSLKDALDRLRQMLDGIRERKDAGSLIILPEMHGSAGFVTTFVAEVFKDYPELSIEELRNNTIGKIMTTSGRVISSIPLSPDRVFEETEKELEKIRTELAEEVRLELEVGTLKKILFDIRESGLLERLPPRTVTRLENLLGGVISHFQGVEKPETFEDDMKSVIRKVKD